MSEALKERWTVFAPDNEHEDLAYVVGEKPPGVGFDDEIVHSVISGENRLTVHMESKRTLIFYGFRFVADLPPPPAKVP